MDTEFQSAIFVSLRAELWGTIRAVVIRTFSTDPGPQSGQVLFKDGDQIIHLFKLTTSGLEDHRRKFRTVFRLSVHADSAPRVAIFHVGADQYFLEPFIQIRECLAKKCLEQLGGSFTIKQVKMLSHDPTDAKKQLRRTFPAGKPCPNQQLNGGYLMLVGQLSGSTAKECTYQIHLLTFVPCNEPGPTGTEHLQADLSSSRNQFKVVEAVTHQIELGSPERSAI